MTIEYVNITVKADDYDNKAGKPFWGDLGAGILCISKKTKKILVSYRSKYVNNPHTWGTVGGAVDDTDKSNIQKAASREFKEETGYSKKMKLYSAFVFKTEGFEYNNFIGLIDNEFKPVLDWETEKFKWVTYDELVKLKPKHHGLKSLLNDKKTVKLIKKILK